MRASRILEPLSPSKPRMDQRDASTPASPDPWSRCLPCRDRKCAMTGIPAVLRARASRHWQTPPTYPSLLPAPEHAVHGGYDLVGDVVHAVSVRDEMMGSADLHEFGSVSEHHRSGAR